MSEPGKEYDFISYESLDDGKIARIMLDRPDAEMR